jgi:ribosomal protein S27AE
MQTPFYAVPVGAQFICNGNRCEKVSRRTARLLDYDRVFYFGRLEGCTMIDSDHEQCPTCSEVTHLSGLIGENATDCPRCGSFVI